MFNKSHKIKAPCNFKKIKLKKNEDYHTLSVEHKISIFYKLFNIIRKYKILISLISTFCYRIWLVSYM